MKQKIEALTQDLFEKVKTHREHLHQFPELSYEEFETSNYVLACLQKMGITSIKKLATTGIEALIVGKNHTENQACVALRADLDALPIHEENDVDYASKIPGKMHACGHDVHTAILLGVAEILVALKDELPQPVKLIFQPGEEKNPGGASLMIQEGVLKNPSVERIYALHVFPDLEVGKVGFKEGIYMASCDEIYMTIHGKGGHGATPHQTIDPIYIGANLITSLQQIVSRKCDPKIPSVLSFGHFEALGATNIIPSKAILKGTFRTLNDTWREEALSLIEKQSTMLVESMGAKLELEISRGYPFLENDKNLTQELQQKANEILGEENVIELPIRLTAEDFSFYGKEVPACFFRIGVRNEARGIVHGVHHPKFDIDENALKIGMKMMAFAVF
jgi:amidohydrolase